MKEEAPLPVGEKRREGGRQLGLGSIEWAGFVATTAWGERMGELRPCECASLLRTAAMWEGAQGSSGPAAAWARASSAPITASL